MKIHIKHCFIDKYFVWKDWGHFACFCKILLFLLNVTFLESFLLISGEVRQNLQKILSVSAVHINPCLRCCTCSDKSKFCKSIGWVFWFTMCIQDYLWFQIFMDFNICWLDLKLNVVIYFHSLFTEMGFLSSFCW